jgi:hypothetical protein
LCNVRQILTLQINALIEFLTFSVCFETHGFILKKPVDTHFVYGIFYII